MGKSIDEYVDAATVELIKKFGCNECNIFNFKIIKDFSKFINFIFTKKEIVVLVFSSSLSEKEESINIAKNIGRSKQITVHVFFLGQASG